MPYDKKETIDILLIDNNITGAELNVGDRVIVNCLYTKNKVILYAWCRYYGKELENYLGLKSLKLENRLLCEE